MDENKKQALYDHVERLRIEVASGMRIDEFIAELVAIQNEINEL